MTEPCGCRILHVYGAQSTILYCPLHLAAAEMLAALKHTLVWTHSFASDSDPRDNGELFRTIREAEALIARAEGRDSQSSTDTKERTKT